MGIFSANELGVFTDFGIPKRTSFLGGREAKLCAFGPTIPSFEVDVSLEEPSKTVVAFLRLTPATVRHHDTQPYPYK